LSMGKRGGGDWETAIIERQGLCTHVRKEENFTKTSIEKRGEVDVATHKERDPEKKKGRKIERWGTGLFATSKGGFCVPFSR